MTGHLILLFKDYFVGGGTCGKFPDWVDVGAAFRSLTRFVPALGMIRVEKMQNRATMMASIQVPFSKTLLVCFTPMN